MAVVPSAPPAAPAAPASAPPGAKPAPVPAAANGSTGTSATSGTSGTSGQADKGLYRQAAVERLSSPDQLDALMQVITSKAWIALITMTILLVGVIVWSIFGTISTQVRAQGVLLRTGGVSNVVSLSAGRVSQVHVEVGDVIRKGQVVATTMAAPDQPNSKITSPWEGRVLEVMVTPGDLLDRGAALVAVEPVDAPLEAVLYMSSADGKKVQPGMPVQLSPSTIKREEYGYIVGRVSSISPYASTRRMMTRILGNENLVNQLTSQAQGTPIDIRVELEPDSRTPTGYRWSSRLGPSQEITSGTFATGMITVREQRPITLVFRYKP